MTERAAPITVTIRDMTGAGKATGTIALKGIERSITLRDLIRTRIREEAACYNAVLADILLGKLFLPVDDDPLLSLILSNAFLPAGDIGITDPSITRQIGAARQHLCPVRLRTRLAGGSVFAAYRGSSPEVLAPAAARRTRAPRYSIGAVSAAA